MIDEIYSAAEDFEVEGGGGVPGLVVVHGDSGREHYGWYAVVGEYFLVGKVVEQFGEVLAAVVGEAEVEADVVCLVAVGKDLLVSGVPYGSVHHYEIVFPAPVERGEGASYLVDVHHEGYLRLLYDFSGYRVDKFFIFNHLPQCIGAGHVHFVGVESGEDEIDREGPA